MEYLKRSIAIARQSHHPTTPHGYLKRLNVIRRLESENGTKGSGEPQEATQGSFGHEENVEG